MKFFMVVIGVIFSLQSVANTDAATEEEKRYLIKISQELAHLDDLATKAANKADPDARITLDYIALRRDLQEMKRAIEAHIKQPSRSPRNLVALEFAGNNSQ
jgi:RAQPRD family integrative conjugative element protein